MLFFPRRRSANGDAGSVPNSEGWPSRRQPVTKCFACGQARPPYVYTEDGHDYCLWCAQGNWTLMRLRPAGPRNGDITLEELLRLGRVA